ncbi:helix-turn-helix domain-containing protein (plasmid) [Leptospira sp. WS39.C2]
MKVKERTGVWVPQWIYELDLNPNQIRLYAEIVSLDSKDGCYASNEYLAKVLRLKQDTVSRLVSQLKQKGLLVQTKFDGRRRFLKPILPIVKSEATYMDPNQKAKNVTEESGGFGSKSKAGLYEKATPYPIYQKQNNIQFKANKSDEIENWKTFLSWSSGKLSESTRISMLALEGPEELSGLQRRYWEQWLVTPGS